MDSLIVAAFRDVISSIRCLPVMPKWENAPKCDLEAKCQNDIEIYIRYLGAPRVAKRCSSTESYPTFQIDLHVPAGNGTELLYKTSDCIICSIRDIQSRTYRDKKTNSEVRLILSGRGNTYPTTGPLLSGVKGRAVLPITVPMRAFYCC